MLFQINSFFCFENLTRRRCQKHQTIFSNVWKHVFAKTHKNNSHQAVSWIFPMWKLPWKKSFAFFSLEGIFDFWRSCSFFFETTFWCCKETLCFYFIVYVFDFFQYIHSFCWKTTIPFEVFFSFGKSFPLIRVWKSFSLWETEETNGSENTQLYDLSRLSTSVILMTLSGFLPSLWRSTSPFLHLGFFPEFWASFPATTSWQTEGVK